MYLIPIYSGTILILLDAKELSLRYWISLQNCFSMWTAVNPNHQWPDITVSFSFGWKRSIILPLYCETILIIILDAKKLSLRYWISLQNCFSMWTAVNPNHQWPDITVSLSFGWKRSIILPLYCETILIIILDAKKLSLRYWISLQNCFSMWTAVNPNHQWPDITVSFSFWLKKKSISTCI